LSFKGWRHDSPCLYPEALEDYPASNADGRRWILRGKIKELFDATFYDSIYLYTMWKRFGLPHGRGWLAESEGVLQRISIVDEERNLYEVSEAEAAREKAKHGNSGRVKGSRSR